MSVISATARHTAARYLLLFSFSTPTVYGQGASRGVQLFDSGDWAGAGAECSAAVQRGGRDARAHYCLGRLAMLKDDADTAAEHFQLAVTLDQSVSDYHLWYGNAIGQQAGRASMLKQPFLARRMKSELERAVELDARNLDARKGLVDFYSMAPEAMGGSTDKAREQAHAIAQVDAMRGHLSFARVAINAKDAPAAERGMNAAIATAPDGRRGYSALAPWYEKDKKGERAEARSAINQAIKLDPRNEEAKKLLKWQLGETTWTPSRRKRGKQESCMCCWR